MSIADDMAQERWERMAAAKVDPRTVHVNGIISASWAYMYQEADGGKILGFSDDPECMTGDARGQNMPHTDWIRFPNAVVDESAWG